MRHVGNMCLASSSIIIKEKKLYHKHFNVCMMLATSTNPPAPKKETPSPKMKYRNVNDWCPYRTCG